jgi:hypothetical protein
VAQALADSEGGVVKRLGHDLLRPTRELFRQWSRCRDGTISRAELSRCLTPVRRAVEGLRLRGLFSGQPRLVGMCRELYEHRQWLWTFLEQEVEPTNNASERALRHAGIRSRDGGDKRTACSRGPSESRGPGFDVEWSEDKAIAELK